MNTIVYRMRFVGGPLSGRTVCVPTFPEHCATSPPTPIADYYLVRLRAYRCVMVEEHLCRRITAWEEINRQISLRVIAEHARYAVCEGCEALLPLAVAAHGLCHHCHSYSFRCGLAAVSEVADRLATNPPAWVRASSSFLGP